MNRNLAAFAVTLTFAFGSVAQGAGYGVAGCGLGSNIWTKNTVVSQICALATNQNSLLPSSITTGTSNCQTSGFVNADKVPEYYANANYDRLVIEMARGQGETLEAFAEAMGCADPIGFASMTRVKYRTLFPSGQTSPMEMLESVKREIQADPLLTAQCRPIA